MDTGRATIFLAGTALIGGAAIGKAAIDHLALPPDQRAIHHGKPKLGRDPVAWVAAIAGFGYAMWEAPTLLREWYGYAEKHLQ